MTHADTDSNTFDQFEISKEFHHLAALLLKTQIHSKEKISKDFDLKKEESDKEDIKNDDQKEVEQMKDDETKEVDEKKNLIETEKEKEKVVSTDKIDDQLKEEETDGKDLVKEERKDGKIEQPKEVDLEKSKETKESIMTPKKNSLPLTPKSSSKSSGKRKKQFLCRDLPKRALLFTQSFDKSSSNNFHFEHVTTEDDDLMNPFLEKHCTSSKKKTKRLKSLYENQIISELECGLSSLCL